MNPTRRADRSLSHYPSRGAEKAREQKETSESLAQSSKRFRAAHSSHIRPSTSASYRDRSPLERSHSDTFDPFLEKLKEDVLAKVDLLSASYLGDSHVSWTGQLFQATRGNISANKKMKYIAVLYPTIGSIKYWSIEAAINFYTSMIKMHFFVDINAFNDSSRFKAEEVHNELINLMTEKFSLSATEKNVRAYISLFWALSNSDFIKNSEKSRLVAKNLVKKMAHAFLVYQKPLTPYLYKEIANYISRLNKINEYESFLNPLVKKHLTEMSEFDISPETNIDFSKYLYNFLNILEHSSTLMPLDENIEREIEKLIAKINFTNNMIGTYLGLRSITAYLLKSEFSLSDKLHEKIKECLSFIWQNKEKLNLISNLSVAISISILCSKLKEIPREYWELFNFCIGGLKKNKDKLSLEELNKLLQIIGNLSTVNASFSNVIELASNIFESKQSDFYLFPKSHLHNFFCKFGIVSRAMILEDAKRYLSIKSKFTAGLRNLTSRYSKYLFSAKLSDQINGYRALSTIAISGFQPNSSTRDILRDLFHSIDKNEKLLDASNHFLIPFLNSTMKLGDLIKLDLDKYTKIFVTHTKKLIANNENEVKKNLMLWPSLAFFVVNRNQLSENNRKKLKKEIKKLYLHLKDTGVKIDNSTLSITEYWLKIERTKKYNHESEASFSQHRMLKKLQAYFKNERFETEVSINNLPPCDIVIPSRNIVIEIQGPHHFLDRDNRYKTGSTLLKLESYRKAGFKVIEVCVDGNEEKESRSVEKCIKEIRDTVSKPRFSQV